MLREKTDFTKGVLNTEVHELGYYPIHFHNCLEIIFVLEGTVRIKDGYWVSEKKEGAVQVIDEGAMHSIEAINGKSKIMILKINTDFLSKYHPNIHSTFFVTTDDDDTEEAKYALDILKSLFCQTYFDSDLSYQNDEKILLETRKIIDILYDYFQYYSLQGESWVNKMDNKNNPTMVKRTHNVRAYVYKNYDRKLTLEEIADRESLSTAYLSHLVKEATQMSFQDFLNMVRVENSERLLLGTDKKISTISIECGFSAVRYYRKYFMKWYGCYPEKYREKCIKKRYSLNERSAPEPIEKENGRGIVKQYLNKYNIGTSLKEIRNVKTIVIEKNSDKGIDADFFRGNYRPTIFFKGAPILHEHLYKTIITKVVLNQEIDIELANTQSLDKELDLYCYNLIEYYDNILSRGILPNIVLRNYEKNTYRIIEYIKNFEGHQKKSVYRFRIVCGKHENEEKMKQLVSTIHTIMKDNCELYFIKEFNMPFFDQSFYKIWKSDDITALLAILKQTFETKKQMNPLKIVFEREQEIKASDFKKVNSLNENISFSNVVNQVFIILSLLKGKMIKKEPGFTIFHSNKCTQIISYCDGNIAGNEDEYIFKIPKEGIEYRTCRIRFDEKKYFSYIHAMAGDTEILSKKEKLIADIAVCPQVEYEKGETTRDLDVFVRHNEACVELIDVRWY